MKSYNLYIGGDVYGAGNIGDDAILEGILFILTELKHDFSYTIGTYDGYKLDISHPHIKYINCYNDVEVIKSIIDSDFVICGGGTLIGDELGVGFPLKFNAELIATSKLLKKKIYLFAIGANKLKTEAGKKIVNKIFGLSDIITLRDKESASVCKDILKENSNIFETADPAFVLQPKRTQRTDEIKKRLGTKDKYFGVNVVNEVWEADKDYKRAIAEACDFVYSNYKYIPVFFCNEIREGTFFDYEANKEVASYLNCKYVLLEPIYYSSGEMIEIISNFQFVLAMRMHALIFASLTNTPFVSLSRVDKVDNFMKLFNLSCSSIKSPDSKLIIKDIEYILENIDEIRKNIDMITPSLRNKSMKNALLFDSFMKNNEKIKSKFNMYSLTFIKYKPLIKHLMIDKLK
jgi:polysaccharide pyruvyl transferase WcaK-like protein